MYSSSDGSYWSVSKRNINFTEIWIPKSVFRLTRLTNLSISWPLQPKHSPLTPSAYKIFRISIYFNSLVSATSKERDEQVVNEKVSFLMQMKALIVLAVTSRRIYRFCVTRMPSMVKFVCSARDQYLKIDEKEARLRSIKSCITRFDVGRSFTFFITWKHAKLKQTLCCCDMWAVRSALSWMLARISWFISA